MGQGFLAPERRVQENTMRLTAIHSLIAIVLLGTAAPALAQQHVEGQTGPGALYALDMPIAWNGDLVVYAHGIVDPALPVALPSTQDHFSILRNALMSRGFAVASSSFSENGFALKDGAQRTHQLTGLFTAQFGRPRRVLLAGHSLGSIAALQVAESFPDQYDGALIMCGFVGGTPREIEYMANARVAFDYFFPDVIDGSVFEIPVDTDFRPPSATTAPSALFVKIQGALAAGFAPPFKTIQFASVAGLKWNTPQELVTAALSVIGFNLRYTRSVLDHTHGHIPFDNRETVYTGSADDAALNEGIERWTGDADAMNYVAQYYTPTGALQIPVQTLHTSRDPVVPAWHEDIFAGNVTDQSATGLLEGNIVTAFGHCNFTDAQALAAFERLVERLP
jgi:pimeloyl-ACP methyl ester carboxylesterase